MLALSLPAIVGAFGFGTEVGYWQLNQRKVQNVADTAAYTAAVSLRSGGLSDAIQQAANIAADESGYVGARGTIVVEQPPVSGAFSGDSTAVEVIVTENLPRMFTSLFAEDTTVAVVGRAVAQLTEGSGACILALDPSASGAVTFIGSSTSYLIGCRVHANSVADDAVLVTGSAAVETPCVSASGDVDADSGLTLTDCANPNGGATAMADPYASLPKPEFATAACKSKTTFGGSPSSVYNITEGRYCGGLKAQRTVNMAPGTYVIDGGELDITSTSNVSGSGVVFFLTNGATVKMNGGSTSTLSAPTSGDYEGVLIFVDGDDPYATHKINGNSSSVFDGAIYASNGHVDILGGSTSGGACPPIVARTIDFSGTTTLQFNCTEVDLIEDPSSGRIALVE